MSDIDPAECDCLGPTQDDVEYEERGGVLYGRRIEALAIAQIGETLT